jgi:hypothetical protein
MLHKLLRKTVYQGRVVVEDWGIDVAGDFEPLLDSETFLLAQAAITGKRPTVSRYQRNHPDFPLRRFVRCGLCSRPLTGAWSKGKRARYAYYNCPGCRRINVPQQQFEARFVELLDRLRPRPEVLRLLSAAVLEGWTEEQKGATFETGPGQAASLGLRSRPTMLESQRGCCRPTKPAGPVRLSPPWSNCSRRSTARPRNSAGCSDRGEPPSGPCWCQVRHNRPILLVRIAMVPPQPSSAPRGLPRCPVGPVLPRSDREAWRDARIQLASIQLRPSWRCSSSTQASSSLPASRHPHHVEERRKSGARILWGLRAQSKLVRA